MMPGQRVIAAPSHLRGCPVVGEQHLDEGPAGAPLRVYLIVESRGRRVSVAPEDVVVVDLVELWLELLEGQVYEPGSA
jgi:hypothetical protein